MTFETSKIGTELDAIAPDGSEVRLLCSLVRGSMAAFGWRRGLYRVPSPIARLRKSGASPPDTGRCGEGSAIARRSPR
jgi:hypothetical protein